jgi:hypothetical protein
MSENDADFVAASDMLGGSHWDDARFWHTCTRRARAVRELRRQAHHLLGPVAAEVFYMPDGKEVWVTVRGENYVPSSTPRPSRRKPGSSRRAVPACRSSRPMASAATSARRSIRKRWLSRWPRTRSWAASSKTALSARTSPPLRMVAKHAHAQGRWQGDGVRCQPVRLLEFTHSDIRAPCGPASRSARPFAGTLPTEAGHLTSTGRSNSDTGVDD